MVVRGDGTPTYFASDIAYHRNKLVTRGFDRVINIWGADHHGHISRMKAVLTALGLDPARLTVVIEPVSSDTREIEISGHGEVAGRYLEAARAWGEASA